MWLLVVLLLGLFSNSWADPRTWDLNGLPVRNSYNVTWQGQVARADDGSVMAIWTDTRDGSRKLYGQLLTPDGTPQWGLDGILLARSEGIGIYWPVITYSQDGWIVLWQDVDRYENGEELTIRGRMKTMKFAASGLALWNDPDQTGLLLFEEQSHSLQEGAQWIEPDDNGGAYVCWINETFFYAQRVTADGSFAWANPLEIAHNGAGWSYAIDKSSDGGLLMAWKQHTTQYQIYCNKINSNGDNAWASPALMCQQSAYLTNVLIQGDNQGGAILAWLDERISEIADVYARQVNGNGTPLWSVNGRLVVSSNYFKTQLKIAPSFNNNVMDGVLLNWSEEINGYSHGFAQKFDLSGNIRYDISGASFCDPISPDAAQQMSTVMSDNVGGALCGWYETNLVEGESRIRLARLDNDSARFVWNTCAVTIREGFDANSPRFFITGDDNILSIWREYQNPGGLMFVHSHSLATGNANFPDALGLDDLIDGESGNQAVLSLPNGRTAIAWDDNRALDSGVYLQFLDSTGTPQFASDGLKAVTATNPNNSPVTTPKLCSDGNDGVFITYLETANGVELTHVTRRNADGVQIGPATGVTVSDAETRSVVITPDENGGAYVAFSALNAQFSLATFATRIDENCQPVWDEPLRISPDDGLENVLQELVQSDDGSAIVVWKVSDFPRSWLKAAKITPDGTIDWQVDITPADSILLDFDVATDHQNGIAVAWQYHYSSGEYSVRVQRVNSDGELMWDPAGYAVATDNLMLYSPKVCVDDRDNLIVAWIKEVLITEDDVFAQKFSPTGEPQWDNNGTFIVNASQSAMLSGLVSTDHQNYYITWTAQESGASTIDPVHVYGTHLNESGQVAGDPFWQNNFGGPICTIADASDLQTEATDDGSVILTWLDSRAYHFLNGLYAQRIHDPIVTAADSKPGVAAEFSLMQNYPNPFNPLTSVEFSLPKAGKATLKVFDVTGRLVTTLVDETLSAGIHRVNFDGAGFGSGIYFYSLKAGVNVSTRKMVMLK